MHQRQLFQPQRATLDLVLGMSIALVLVFLNLWVNFIDAFHRFFAHYAQFPLMSILVNLLLFWLAVLLWLAFLRWRAMYRRQADLQAVISGISPDALIVADMNRRILMCNDSIYRLFGYRPGEVIGRTTDLLYGDRRANRDARHEIHDALERDGFHVGLATGRRKDTTTFPLEIITGDIQGRVGAVLLLRDIRFRVSQEEKRRRMESQMQQQQKLESLGMLAGGIAHDFNNVLGAIMGNADLALQDLAEQSPLKPRLEAIMSSGRRAALLCRELLAYAGKGRYAVEPLDLSEVIREMESFVGASLSKKLRVEYRLAPGLPPVKADVTQLRQVLINLMTNASDAVGDAGGTVTLTTARHEVPAGDPGIAGYCVDGPPRPGTYVRLTVEDNGSGMEPGIAGKAAEPFFTTKPDARGLGLSAVHGIVRAHRGTLVLDSRPGRGTAATVLLPVMHAAQAPAGPAEAWRAAGTVLVVDDEPPIRELAANMLRRAGLEVIQAADGDEAVARFREAAAVRLVLLDVSMPGMSGQEVYAELQAVRPGVPVLFSSGYIEERAVNIAEPRGPIGFVQKPYRMEELIQEARALLEPS
ncbi:MAG: response regulator [Lentisphaerae bacterium]|nr:response regulator [Lentisphaerota bacterium]